jgi:hypothetical protein
MNRGFSLIEVLIALCILMMSCIAVAGLQVTCFRAKAYGEYVTRATVLGNSRLWDLRSVPEGVPELRQGWHQDQDNPIRDSGMPLYRFWSVSDRPEGKDIAVYVAWADGTRVRARDFGSLSELRSSRCPSIDLHDFRLMLK